MSLKHIELVSWQSLIVDPLKLLMDASPSYTPAERERFLGLIRRRMVDNRALGTAPTSSIARWKPIMCDDGSPLEYSLSIKKNSCIVRTYHILFARSRYQSHPFITASWAKLLHIMWTRLIGEYFMQL
jgi:hypothetical protein